MCRLCWGVLFVLVLGIGVVVYRFGFLGSALPGEDGRQAIQLDSGERNLVLAEMRAFLEAVQMITAGLAENRMGNVVTAARRVGLAAQKGVPLSLMGKLPLEFKQLGLDTHRKFDRLALDAEQLGDPDHTLEQLSELLRNCAGCHAGYSLVVARSP